MLLSSFNFCTDLMAFDKFELPSSLFPLTVYERKLTCPGNCPLHPPPPTITLERFGDYVYKKISLAAVSILPLERFGDYVCKIAVALCLQTKL